MRWIVCAGVVTTLAGSGSATFANGLGAAASFKNPYSVSVDSKGIVYVADTNNNRIRKVSSSGWCLDSLDFSLTASVSVWFIWGRMCMWGYVLVFIWVDDLVYVMLTNCPYILWMPM
jgi:hypothetical protein